MKRYSLLLFFIVLVIIDASAQMNLKIKRIPSPLKFDGDPSDTAWCQLDLFPLTMQLPVYGKEPVEKTDVMIGYDDKYLWIGARLLMQDPDKIFAVSKKRDEDLRSFDSFGILLDTYNDYENGLAFFTTPTGLRTDYAVSNDAVGPGPGPDGTFIQFNYSWNTFWDVLTTRDAKGWYLEMRIPFSSLRFRPENNLTTMGIIIVRTTSYNNETDTYPAIDHKYGFFATNKPSLASRIVFENLITERPFYISPYMIGGVTKDWKLNPGEAEYKLYEKSNLNAGIDFKHSLSSNLTLDVTVNTDFAQVEADNQQVNLTRYSLFMPEKRMFFQERSSLFSFSLGEMSDLFYSRTIGKYNEEAVRIFGGARLVGKMGRWELGLINMQTEKFRELPSENFGVYRIRRQVLNPYSYVGGILTTRLGINGNWNYAYGLDGLFKVFRDDFMNIKIAGTEDNNIESRFNSLKSSFISLQWERRSDQGLTYNINYSYSGEDFTPKVGFVRRDSLQSINGRVQYSWIFPEKSKLFNLSAGITGERSMRLPGGELETIILSPEIKANTKNGFHYEIAGYYHKEGVSRKFGLSDSVYVEAGTYTFSDVRIQINTPRTRSISGRYEFVSGYFWDGWKNTFTATNYLNPSSSLQLNATYTYNSIKFPDRDKLNSLRIHLVNFGALYMLNTKLSVSALIQYVTSDSRIISNFRLRFNPSEGNDLYLVFNDYRTLGNDENPIKLPEFFNRTVMLKYTHTFLL